MANATEKVNGIAIANIQAINGITDGNLQALNGLEFTGYNPTEAHTLIATATASASATLSFTSGIDSTYDAYEFHMVNMHPASDGVDFGFQVNADGQTGFNEVMTTTFVEAYHNESDANAVLTYDGADDQAEGTAYQVLGGTVGSDADQSVSGVLTLYDPSSTTYVKHFTSNTNVYHNADFTTQNLMAGYINVTAAIDEISFKFNSGNIDAGVIKMYGIAKA